MSKPQKLYTIQYWMELPKNSSKWTDMFPFAHMRKSEATGAWSMLKSFYNQKRRHRLIDSQGNVIEEIGKQEVHVNS